LKKNGEILPILSFLCCVFVKMSQYLGMGVLLFYSFLVK